MLESAYNYENIGVAQPAEEMRHCKTLQVIQLAGKDYIVTMDSKKPMFIQEDRLIPLIKEYFFEANDKVSN